MVVDRFHPGNIGLDIGEKEIEKGTNVYSLYLILLDGL
jgi:hypothetical protein